MKNNIFVKDYKSVLSIKETELAIKLVKDTFERKLAEKLNLMRVSAPIFVEPNTGLNDNLNGYEKAVNFKCIETGTNLEIVHSLAKWKRNALAK
ncbi:MAG: aspartate--ammonia ligase, partial [Bacilli bacterium]|nr:aspartate--ammonia ligase [Bacilli bacterium]